MNKIKKVVICVISIIFLFSLTACSRDKTEEELLREKTLYELEFLEDTCISIVEKYLSDDYLENGIINWQAIKSDFGEISDGSSVVILDLTSLKVENSKILEFETKINNINSSIEGGLEISLLENLKEFYKLIPDYLKEIYPENEILYLESIVKSNLLESVYYCEINNFPESFSFAENAENIYKELINNQNFLSENSYDANRVYVAIQEMKVAIQNEEKENTILKYISTN